VCIKLGATIQTGVGAEKRKAKADYEKHRKLFDAERAAYHSRIAKSKRNSGTHMSVIIDGSSPVCNFLCPYVWVDLFQVPMPWIFPFPKDYLKSHRFKLCVNGLINHGFNERTLWLHGNQWGKGPNMTCSLLLHHFKIIADTKTQLPSTLWLQVMIFHFSFVSCFKHFDKMDNCGGENKNKYVLAFLCWLVHLKVSNDLTRRLQL
jgi:hypothetical protein